MNKKKKPVLCSCGGGAGSPPRYEVGRIVLDSRVALTRSEAATALGVSEQELRGLPSLPRFTIGGTTLIPIGGLRCWIDEQAEIDAQEARRIAHEIIHDLGLDVPVVTE